MAKSMIRRRQEAERQRIDVFEASLKRVSRTARQPPDFQRALDEAAKGLGGVAIREAADWRPKLKTRDAGRLLLAAARHLYARYPVPAHLEAVWLDARGLTADEARLRRRWYVTAAGGGSLFKAQPHAWLSRKEVHAFLTTGGDLSFDEAFWFAIAKSYTDDAALALRIAKTKIAQSPRGAIAFWREAVRFFCAQPATREEIDDLCDFFEAARRREAGYSLKGRTLASLRRQMLDWHRDVAAIERIEALRRRGRRGGAGPDTPAGRWEGAKLADWVWEPSVKEAKSQRRAVRDPTAHFGRRPRARKPRHASLRGDLCR
jgi:hypothetical protein